VVDTAHREPSLERRRVADEVGAAPRRVLIALQDPVTAGSLAKGFSDLRVIPTLAFSCDELIHQVRDQRHGLIVLDHGFACDHGSRCLKEVRAASDAPILAVAEIEGDKHAGLDLALSPATAPAEIARRGTALIDISRPVPLPHPIRWGHLELNLRSHQARWRTRPLHLTPTEFRIMEVLVLAAGAVVTTEQLARRVWGESSFDDSEPLVAHVRRIRKKIERDPSASVFLLRVRGEGFRLTDLSEETSDSSAQREGSTFPV
jgi:two-component system KDP operon response regulator KdpE